VTITRYHVDYVRSDGRNTQGVDVPYSFDGGVTFTVTESRPRPSRAGAGAGEARAAPHLAARAGGQIAISTIAQVTFYGVTSGQRRERVGQHRRQLRRLGRPDHLGQRELGMQASHFLDSAGAASWRDHTPSSWPHSAWQRSSRRRVQHGGDHDPALTDPRPSAAPSACRSRRTCCRRTASPPRASRSCHQRDRAACRGLPAAPRHVGSLEQPRPDQPPRPQGRRELATKFPVTGGDGRATSPTRPARRRVGQQRQDEIYLTISATPVGSDYSAALPRSARIRLVRSARSSSRSPAIN